MRWLLHRHPLALAVVVFVALMVGLKFGMIAAVGQYGPWIAIPIVGAFLVIGFLLERRDRQRDG